MSYTLPEVSLMQVKAEKATDHVGTFVVEPLLPGFGLTIGNALRRVLLSSLPGAAITSIRIDGVAHEFTTIKGVRQDVVDIILNLKQVRLNVESDEPQVIILDAKGEKSVKAGDFKCPTGVEVINKDLPIADLIAGGKLLLEATVERGRGYVPTEMRKDEKLPIGVIAIDSAFSPVKRVNFNTENTRVGKMTNFDRLVMEIETDGSITPQQALEQSSAVLVDHFSVIAGSEPTDTAVAEQSEDVASDEDVVTEEAPKAKKSTKKASK
jgi:DNA-directed RNA polymerase subunit alpha